MIIFGILIYLAIGALVVYMNNDYMAGYLFGIKDTVIGDHEFMEKQIETFKIEDADGFYKKTDKGLTIFAYVVNTIIWPRIVFLDFKVWIEIFIEMMR